MPFGGDARAQQARFRATLPEAARTPGDDRGLRHGHLLALGHELENLIPELRGDGGADDFFHALRIKWWRSGRSGAAATPRARTGRRATWPAPRSPASTSCSRSLAGPPRCWPSSASSTPKSSPSSPSLIRWEPSPPWSSSIRAWPGRRRRPRGGGLPRGEPGLPAGGAQDSAGSALPEARHRRGGRAGSKLRDPAGISVASSEALVAGLRASEQAVNLGVWLDYHARRYAW